jgi:methylenetetrahydrofolate reductase (NADPH)
MTLIRPLLEGYSIEVMSCNMADIAATHGSLPHPAAVLIPALASESLPEQARAASEARALGFEPVCHIAARRLQSRARLEAHLVALRAEAKAKAVFLIAGDRPDSAGPFGTALDLLATGLFAQHGFETIGIAGHPEGHPAVSDDVLWSALCAKSEAIAAAGMRCEVVTQFAFDAAKVLSWIAGVRARSIDATLRIGVPGPANVMTLLRYARICGVNASAGTVAKYGFSLARLLGSAGPERFVSELAEGLERMGEHKVKLHVFPFGGFAAAARWLNSASHQAAA